jgi:hypothetical protein
MISSVYGCCSAQFLRQVTIVNQAGTATLANCSRYGNDWDSAGLYSTPTISITNGNEIRIQAQNLCGKTMAYFSGIEMIQ